jgi:hypothetical protein
LQALKCVGHIDRARATEHGIPLGFAMTQRPERHELLPQAMLKPPVKAAGIEPAVDFDPSDKLDCGCVICEECRAAMVLYPHSLDWLDLALADADLQSVIRAWKGLAEPIRRAIWALLGSQGL